MFISNKKNSTFTQKNGPIPFDFSIKIVEKQNKKVWLI